MNEHPLRIPYHEPSAAPQSEPSGPVPARRTLRILFTFIGGSGHFRPLIPLARAAQAAGHAVAVAGASSRQAEIAAAGFTGFATRPSPPSPPSPPTPPTPNGQPQPVGDRNSLERPDPQREQLWLAEGFARRGARRHVTSITEIAREFRPDVLVRDEVDFGTAIVAELLGIPCVTVSVLAAGGFLHNEVVAQPLHELRSEHGLPADPQLSMLDGGLVLAPYPPSFRDPAFPLPPHAFSFRPHTVLPRRSASDTPTVYFTLGTVRTATDLYDRVLAGLRELPVNAVLTVGDRFDPAELGPQPAHIRIERFIPQEELLPQCDLVVCHGGSGSVLGALAHGVPSILAPMSADQPYNARRCVELGTSRVLDPVLATPDDVREAVSEVLADPSYRHAAERVQAEYNALPGSAEAVALIERLRAG
jgi:UDP:flavonoid glycosyltransferase YjiC (YdhE family)